MKIRSKLLIALVAGTLVGAGGGVASAATANPNLGIPLNAGSAVQSSPSGSKTALAPPVSGNIVGRDSGRCLDVTGGPGHGANATPIQVYDCLGSAQYNQRWTFNFVFYSFYWERDVYQVKSLDNGRCLDVRGGPGSLANTTPVQIYDCLGTSQTNQLWVLGTFGNGVQIVDYDSSLSAPKCLDVTGGPGHGTNTTPIQIYDCLGANQTNQLWYLY